jgi:prepilin-type N-terminal cleavage/methylation domain-containing protein
MHASFVPIGVSSAIEAQRRSATEPPRPLPRRCAFTFLELVVVMLILGIMAAVAVPTFSDSLMYHRVESAARRAKADLEQLRQTARRTSRTQALTFGESSYTLPPDVPGLGQATESYTVDFMQPPYQLNSVTIDFDDSPTLSFDGHGMPSLGGSFVFQAGDYVRTIELDGNTGEITISSDDDNQGSSDDDDQGEN